MILPIHLFSLFLVILEIFPKFCNTILSSNFGTLVTAGFLSKYITFYITFWSVSTSKWTLGTPSQISPTKQLNLVFFNFWFFCSNRLLLTIIKLRTSLILQKILLNKVLNCLWLPLMWIPFSRKCHLMKLLKYALTNYLNLVKRFQALTNKF